LSQLLPAAFLCILLAGSLQGSVSFSDTGPNLVLAGTTYEIHFSRSNGAVLLIVDRTTGQAVSTGSKNECLWGTFEKCSGNGTFLGGCSFTGDGFSYRWDPPSSTLHFTYMNASASASASVQVVAADDYLDMTMQMTNRSSLTLEFVNFPSELIVKEHEIVEFFLPLLPGIAFQQPYFTQPREQRLAYPAEAWANFKAMRSTSGQLAIYELFGAGSIPQSHLGFFHDGSASDQLLLLHEYAVYAGPGQTWSSPAVRFRVGQNIDTTIQSYRRDNALHSVVPLRQRLGTLFDRTSAAPLLKLDAVQLGIRFTDYPARVFDRAPGPMLLHPVAFQTRGFDESMPEYFPSPWGTKEEYLEAMQAGQHGHLVMPYTNRTFWDDEGLANVDDVAVIDCCTRQPVRETYGTHGGVAISPHSATARTRNKMNDEFFAQGSDFIFVDQEGARRWLADCSVPAPDPVSYMQGWVDNARDSQPKPLHTEGGYDRLCGLMAGFHGSFLGNAALASAEGTVNYRMYPLASMVLRDLVFFYQHDLDERFFAISNALLAFNVAAGYHLSLNATDTIGGTNASWLRAASELQQHVLSRYADRLVTAYADDGRKTTTRFGDDITAIRNLDAAAPLDSGSNTIAPSGVVVAGADGSWTAGIFTRFNGQPLSAGDHILIVERGPARVTIRQPRGTDTDLTIPLGSWKATDSFEVRAFDLGGNPLGLATTQVQPSGIVFRYQMAINGQQTGRYEVVNRGASRRRSVRRSG
jgi:hypothetical protein